MTTDTTYIELLRMAHESLDSKDAKIAELQKEKAEYIPVLAWIARECNQVDGDMLHRLKSYLEILKLEQQAKGVSDFVYSIEGFSEGYIQALKEQDND
jgi:hypothetical protein